MDLAKELELEKELLSMLGFHPTKVINLLQIEPKQLSVKAHQVILSEIIKLHDKEEFIEFTTIMHNVPNEFYDNLTDIISGDNISSLLGIENRFLTIQKYILENYKHRVINYLSEQHKNGSLTNDDYLEKVSKIKELKIKENSTVLTEEEIVNNINVEKSRIMLSNYPVFNDTLKIVKGDLIMIGASTGVGKSGLLLNLMNELMDNYQCIYFNLEMSKSTIYARILSIRSNVPLKYIYGPKETEYQAGVVDRALKEIASKKIIIEHKSSYIQEVKTVINRYKDPKLHTIIFIDHIGLLKSDKNKNKSLYEQATEVAKQLRQFCLDYDCTIISACQLNRTSYKTDEPSLEMLKDSGELENSSSKVILLYKNKKQSNHNDQFTDDMIVDIVKNRDGRLGKIKFKYFKSKQKFKEDISYET